MTTGIGHDEQHAEFMENTRPGMQRAEERATEAAERTRDQLQGAADAVRSRTESATHEAASRVDEAMTATGSRIQDAARTLREHAPNGPAGEVAEVAARALDRSGEYLRRSDVQSVRGDLEQVIRDYPIQSLAVGLGIGYLLARSMRAQRR